VLTRVRSFLLEYLRINAIRRMLNIVEVRRTEIAGLVFLAAVFAVFEGVGLALLLPILQYAESGETAITESSGAIWQGINSVMETLGLPITLPVLLMLAFVPILLRQAVFYLNAWYSAIVSGRIGVRMRMSTLDAILGADPEYFARYAVGRLASVVITQTIAAGTAVLAVIKQLSIGFLLLLYVALMLAISVPLTLATIAFAAVISVIIKGNIKEIRDFSITAANVAQDMHGKVIERLGLVRLIKLRDQEATESGRIQRFSEALRDVAVKQARLGARIEVTADPLLMLSVFVTLYIGITVLDMTLAQLGLLLFVLNRLNAKVKEFNAGQQQISASMGGILLVQSTTADALASNTIRGGSKPFEDLRHEIVFENVCFDYPKAVMWDGSESQPATVLTDISARIPAGSFTAIVGRSGAGKSTLVELLPRLRDTTQGSITFDGAEIREFEIGSLRKGVGYLTQDAMLFDDSIRANLTYGLDFEPTDDQIRDSLERAYATFVYDLPGALDTQLGDRGARFSGGERQRIALARVLLEDTSILILDEPTSALDSESEMYIQKALADLHGQKTIIVIAHRLATVIQADQLLVIENGRIAERGTHDELVANQGPYHKLFESQLMA